MILDGSRTNAVAPKGRLESWMQKCPCWHFCIKSVFVSPNTPDKFPYSEHQADHDMRWWWCTYVHVLFLVSFVFGLGTGFKCGLCQVINVCWVLDILTSKNESKSLPTFGVVVIVVVKGYEGGDVRKDIMITTSISQGHDFSVNKRHTRHEANEKRHIFGISVFESLGISFFLKISFVPSRALMW